jgi:hypothetical protein
LEIKEIEERMERERKSKRNTIIFSTLGIVIAAAGFVAYKVLQKH